MKCIRGIRYNEVRAIGVLGPLPTNSKLNEIGHRYRVSCKLEQKRLSSLKFLKQRSVLFFFFELTCREFSISIFK